MVETHGTLRPAAGKARPNRAIRVHQLALVCMHVVGTVLPRCSSSSLTLSLSLSRLTVTIGRPSYSIVGPENPFGWWPGVVAVAVGRRRRARPRPAFTVDNTLSEAAQIRRLLRMEDKEQESMHGARPFVAVFICSNCSVCVGRYIP